MLLSQFQSVGRDLCNRGLVCSRNGSLSIRLRDHLVITRCGSKLSELEENDLIETGINKNDRFTPLASDELPIHRAIYQQTSALAIIHAHPPHAVALSLVETEVVPNYGEGLCVVERVPVLGWQADSKPCDLADGIAQALEECRVILIHGYGSFATGQLLEAAHNYTTILEYSCQVICILKSLNAGIPKQ
ncbi:aldolase [Chloroflexota bacterium]